MNSRFFKGEMVEYTDRYGRVLDRAHIKDIEGYHAEIEAGAHGDTWWIPLERLRKLAADPQNSAR